MLLAFRNDERVFLHLDWLEGACIVLRHFLFTLLFLLFSFSFVFYLLLPSPHSGDIYLLVEIMARAQFDSGQPCLHQFLEWFWKLI